MDLRIEHEISGLLDQVEAAILDPRTLVRLPTFAPAVAAARELTRRDRGDRVEREALYTADFVPAPLAAVIPRAWTTWIERTTWDRRRHAATFWVEPQLPPALRRRVSCSGNYELHERPGGRTRRLITGVLQIDAPVVGPGAEAVLARLICQQFAGEAAMLTAIVGGLDDRG